MTTHVITITVILTNGVSTSVGDDVGDGRSTSCIGTDGDDGDSISIGDDVGIDDISDDSGNALGGW